MPYPSNPSNPSNPSDPTKPIRKERFLSDYKMHYLSREFPLLAFTYAVVAGGENTIYCDFTSEYAKAYLLDPFGGDASKVPPHVQKFLARLGELEDRSKNRSQVVHATPADWKVFLECLEVELNTGSIPELAW